MRNAFDYYDDDLYLAHHGIKGQKWGVRRYQNEDGSLTSEGLRRYGPNGANYLNAKAEKRANDKAYNKAFNKAYDRRIAAYSPIKSHREKEEQRWQDAIDAADKKIESDKKYKEARKQMWQETDFKGKLKKAATVTAIAAGTAAVAYGLHKLDKVAVSSLAKNDIEKGKHYLDRLNLSEQNRYHIFESEHKLLSLASKTADKSLKDMYNNAARAHGKLSYEQAALSATYKRLANESFERAARGKYSARDKANMIKYLLGHKAFR